MTDSPTRRKVSDLVARFLRDKGVRNVYLVSGGGMMHLLDSVGRETELRYVCNHHEQASAIAAESEARLTGRTGVCLVTTGPGATNALSGIVGAWYDSIPVLVISGQVRTQLMADFSRVRQLGPQEVNIGGMARSVTKYFATVLDPCRILYELERAWHEARVGRQGPVWVDVPLDVQAALVEESELPHFQVPEEAPLAPSNAEIDAVAEALARSRRPLLLLGNGVRLSGAVEECRAFVERHRVPAVVTTGGADLLPEAHPLFLGRVGPIGQRRANFAVQTADLLLTVGASLSPTSIGFSTDTFAPRARKFVVNVDPGELEKPTIPRELAIRADARAFLQTLDRRLSMPPSGHDDWLAACGEWKSRYSPVTPDYYADRKFANSYALAAALSNALAEEAVVVTGNSMDWWSMYQAFASKKGQRLYTNLNYGAMGWDLPAAIGACCGAKRSVVLVTGDGGIQTNVHELGTIGHARLPIKIFVLSNGGYQSIRATQDSFFGGFHVGSSESSGVGIPHFPSLAAAHRIPYVRLGNNEEMPDVIADVLSREGPVLCEVMLNPSQERLPRVKSYRREDGTMASPALEDMSPPLPKEEVEAILRRFDGTRS